MINPSAGASTRSSSQPSFNGTFDERSIQGFPTCVGPFVDTGDVRRGQDRAGVLAARARLRRDPAGEAPRAGAGRRRRPHVAIRRQPRHRDVGVPGRCAAGPVRRDASTLPGGRLPGARQVRLPQRRGRRAGPAGTSTAGRSSACTRTRPPTWSGRRGHRRAGGRATRTGRARRHRRDRRQRALGRRAPGRRPGRRRRRGWSAAASHAC